MSISKRLRTNPSTLDEAPTVEHASQLAPSHGQVRFDPLGVGPIIGTLNYALILTLCR